MKILQVTPYFGEAPGYGGIPRMVRDLSRSLAGQGHEVRVVTTDAWDERSRGRSGSFQDSAHGPSVDAFPNLSNALAYRYQLYLPRGMSAHLRDTLGKYDIVHLHGHRNVPEALAGMRASELGIPVILSAHGTVERIASKKRIKVLFDTLIGNRLLERITLFAALSEAEQGQYLRAGIDARRIRIVPNGFAPPHAEPGDAKAFRERIGAGTDARLVLSLSQITRIKGLDLALRALSHVTTPEVHLIIAGNDAGYLGALKRMASNLNLSDRVHFPGYLSGADKASALAAADLLVCPYQSDAFSVSAIEAAFAKKPVVIPESSGAGQALLSVDGAFRFDGESPEDLAGVLDQILSNPSEAGDKAARAREFVVSELSWERVVPRMIALYQEAMSMTDKERGI